jgi:hypothetical protein
MDWMSSDLFAWLLSLANLRSMVLLLFAVPLQFRTLITLLVMYRPTGADLG